MVKCFFIRTRVKTGIQTTEFESDALLRSATAPHSMTKIRFIFQLIAVRVLDKRIELNVMILFIF